MSWVLCPARLATRTWRGSTQITALQQKCQTCALSYSRLSRSASYIWQWEISAKCWKRQKWSSLLAATRPAPASTLTKNFSKCLCCNICVPIEAFEVRRTEGFLSVLLVHLLPSLLDASYLHQRIQARQRNPEESCNLPFQKAMHLVNQSTSCKCSWQLTTVHLWLHLRCAY